MQSSRMFSQCHQGARLATWTKDQRRQKHEAFYCKGWAFEEHFKNYSNRNHNDNQQDHRAIFDTCRWAKHSGAKRIRYKRHDAPGIHHLWHIAYSLIASLFLLIRKQLTGKKVWQGLTYGIAVAVIWIVYLLEPLPHVAPLDRPWRRFLSTIRSAPGRWIGQAKRGAGSTPQFRPRKSNS